MCFGNHKGHEGPRGAGAPRRTERAGAKRQTFHGHGERRTERPYGATGEAVAQSGVSRKGQASKLLNFQTSTKGARPARGPGGAWRASQATLWFWGDSAAAAAVLAPQSHPPINKYPIELIASPLRPLYLCEYCAGNRVKIETEAQKISVSVYLIALRPHYSFSTSELMR